MDIPCLASLASNIRVRPQAGWPDRHGAQPPLRFPGATRLFRGLSLRRDIPGSASSSVLCRRASPNRQKLSRL